MTKDKIEKGQSKNESIKISVEKILPQIGINIKMVIVDNKKRVIIKK